LDSQKALFYFGEKRKIFFILNNFAKIKINMIKDIENINEI